MQSSSACLGTEQSSVPVMQLLRESAPADSLLVRSKHGDGLACLPVVLLSRPLAGAAKRAPPLAAAALVAGKHAVNNNIILYYREAQDRVGEQQAALLGGGRSSCRCSSV